MAQEPDETPEARGEESSEEEAPAPTPIDHPLFLPGVLVALMLWFGYDGWFNDDPGMQEHLAFNRGGFGVLSVLFAWFGYKGWGEFKADREAAARRQGEDPGPR